MYATPRPDAFAPVARAAGDGRGCQPIICATRRIIDRREQPPLGAGEAAATPVPAALANAVFDATGARLRNVPFTAAKVKAMLA